MAKHDYTAANISNISSEITAMKNVTNSELSIESMPFAWNTGIIRGVVQWAEIKMLIHEKDKLTEFFEQANNKLSEKSENIESFDNNVSSQIEKILNNLNSINSSILNLTNQAVEYGVVQENKAWIRAIKIEINSEEIKRLMDLDVNKLTDEDKRRIQVILKHLSKEINIDKNMSDDTKEKIRQFNILYEKLHEDEMHNINIFFDNSAKDGLSNQDIECIKFLAYTSQGDVHKLFFDNISKCRVNSWNYNGEISHYNPIDHPKWALDEVSGVYLNIEGNDGLNDKEGAFTTFFHEIGHNIDDVMFDGDFEFDSNGVKVNGATTTYVIQLNFKKNFYSALYDDTKDYFTKCTDNVNEILGAFKLNEESKKQVVDALLDGRKKWTTLNPYEKKIYDIVQGSIELTVKNTSIADLIGGVTNNTVSGMSGSWESIVATGGAGHGRNNWGFRNDYWYDGNKETDKQGAEFFAEYMSYKMTGQENKIKEMKNIFPTACDMMERVYKTGGISYRDGIDDDMFYDWGNSIINAINEQE